MAQMQPPNNPTGFYTPGQQPPPGGYPPGQGPYPPQGGPSPYPAQGQPAYPQYPYQNTQQGYPNTQSPYPNQGPYPPVTAQHAFQTSAPAPPGPQGDGDLPPAPSYPGAPPLPPNPSALPTQPTAPSFSNIPGFADSSFTPTVQPPLNPYFNPDEQIPTYERTLPASTTITEEEIKSGLAEWVNGECCYGKPDPIKITDTKMKSAVKYQMHSFVEERQTVWKFEPYTGQVLDGPPMGRMLGPWEFQMYPSAPFKAEQKSLRIPNTTNVRQCHNCHGYGRVRCGKCDGFGTRDCTWCNGSGRRFSDPCDKCVNSSGRVRCTNCSSHGVTKCGECNGRGQLFMYLELIVNWTNYMDEFISDSTVIPKDLLSKAQAKQAICEQNKRVAPFTNLPDQALNDASRDFVNKHGQTYSGKGVILEQKQTVDIIRIAEVSYNWGDKQSGTFHVFGDNNNVYFPDYPAKCCSSCIIL